MIYEETARVIAAYKEIDAAEISPEMTFTDLGLDSLDTVELAMSLEEKFGITLELSEDIATVGDLVAAIEKANA